MLRTVVWSVEESNGAEAWCLIHSRYALDTQNRHYAMMQNISMPAKPLCDHTEGFEPGLRVWELDVGEWERASGTSLADAVKYTVMMNTAPDFSWEQVAVGCLCKQYRCSNSIVAMVLLCPNLWVISDRVSCKSNRCG